jgi:predicted nucleotidyltransferase component of viral defense system
VYRDYFILKGALLLLAYKIPVVRPSKDIDFLGEKTSSDPDSIRKVIQQIASVDLEDGVRFSQNEIDLEQITDDAEYGGLRVKISATVGGDRHRLQLDIGFGDKIVDGPVDMDYPTLLEYQAPNIKVYTLESAVAEKFEAIVSLGTFGSRMKDFFDIWFLIQNVKLNPDRLHKAIHKTFNRRNTPIEDSGYIFSEEFHSDPEKQRQWQAFLRRTAIDHDHSFGKVVHQIATFIKTLL